MRKFLPFFCLVITVLALIHFEAAVSIKMFTQPWPVRKGLNMISCLAYEKAKELNKKVCRIAYNKYEPDGIHYNFIAGINLCSSSTDMTKFVQWNDTMLMSGKYKLYEGSWFIGIHVVEEDNNSKYFCHARGPKYRESIQIQLVFYAEGLNKCHPVTNLTTTTDVPTTKLAQPTTGPLTEGNETAGGKPNQESGKANCSLWIAGFVIASAIAIIAICFHCHHCREHHGCSSHQQEVNLSSSVSDRGPSGCDAIGEEDKKATTDDSQLLNFRGHSVNYSHKDFIRQRNGLVNSLE